MVLGAAPAHNASAVSRGCCLVRASRAFEHEAHVRLHLLILGDLQAWDGLSWRQYLDEHELADVLVCVVSSSNLWA